MNFLRRWLRRRRERERAIRAAQRYTDSLVLFPAIWKEVGGDPVQFLYHATAHTSRSPAWRFGEEWSHAPENPGHWAAKRYKEARKT